MAYWSTKRNNREQKNRPQVRSVFFGHLHDADFELLVALDAAGAEFDPSTTDRLRERDPLEVGILATHSARVELRCADAVRISPCHAGSFFTNNTDVA